MSRETERLERIVREKIQHKLDVGQLLDAYKRLLQLVKALRDEYVDTLTRIKSDFDLQAKEIESNKERIRKLEGADGGNTAG